MPSGSRPSVPFTVAAILGVLAAFAFVAWLVFDVGCDNFPDAILFRSFCGKDFWSVGGPVLGLTVLLLVASAVAQHRGRR